MIIKSLRLVSVHPLKGSVGILAVIQIDAEIDLPITESSAVLETEFRFLFGGTEAEH